MNDKPDNPFKFWEELKRRKVVRVIVGYLASAYVLLELTSIIAEPWGLPGWTINFVSVLLIIGFFVTVIISWIFDVTPEGIKKTESAKVIKLKETFSAPAKRKLRVSDAIIGFLLVAVVILAYPKIFKKDKFRDIRDEDGRISVVVMPFQNMTNDTLWDVWQEGIPNELIADLSNFNDELSVRQFQSIYDILESTNISSYASITPSFASDIGHKLEANTFILGSIKRSGDKFRINAQLSNTETNEIYKTFEIDGNSEEDIFAVLDTLKILIRNYLLVEGMIRNTDYEITRWITTQNPEACRYYLQGIKQFYARDWKSAIESFTEVHRIDSSSLMQYSYLIPAYINSSQYEKARMVFNNQLYEHMEDKNLSYMDKLTIKYWQAVIDKNPTEEIKYGKLILELDPQQRVMYYSLGYAYCLIWQYDKAIPAFEKVLELDRQMGVSWEWAPTYIFLGESYHKVGNHKREKEVYELGLKLFPEDPGILNLQATCALSLGDTIKANGYLTKYFTIREERGITELQKLFTLGNIYRDANIIDKAEQYYRQALALNPNHSNAMNNLASLYFENDINISQGMDYINKALEFIPESSTFLHTKGWGLYRQGKYEESLDLLEKSWDQMPEYSHQHYLDIQEVKQALARQSSEK